MINVSFPGKLFLMGEYAVLKPGQRSVIKSVNRYLHLQIEAAANWEVVSSFGHVIGDRVFSMTEMPEVSAVLNTLSDYFSRPLQTLKITIQSELDEGDKKYGFGSSGVVIVALVSAILKHEHEALNKLERFKLCVLVQDSIQKYSSGGDLAVSIFGGVISYARYDIKWLQKQDRDLKHLVHTDWPRLDIQDLDLETFAHVAIGWTQKSNRTDTFTEAVDAQAKRDPMTYRAFLVSADLFVGNFIEAIKKRDFVAMTQSIQSYRTLMRDLGSWAEIAIETQELQALIESSLDLGFPAKISGSGGGDCGFALLMNDDIKDLSKLKETWMNQGIRMIEE